MSAAREDGLLQRALASAYDGAIGRAERAGLGAWRGELLGGIEGTVLELGPGTGLNLPHYGGGVEQLFLAEPAAHMRGRLRARLVERGLPGEVLPVSARKVPLPDGSVDVVVATLLLCSVRQVEQTLATIRRLLRPGGRYIFIEHVGATPGGTTRRLQHLVEPLWRQVSGDCRLTRDTEATLQAAGWRFERLLRDPIPGAPGLVSPAIRGVARPA